MIRLLRFLPTQWWRPSAWRSWKTYVHWRMETYGVYYPSGEKNPTAMRQLRAQFGSYYRWLGDFDRLRRQKLSTR